jgi:tetrapyrrole methylase family protein/MazG family protein
MSLDYAGLLPVLQQLGCRVAGGCQIIMGESVMRQHYPRLDPDQPALLVGLRGDAWAHRLAEALLKVYSPEHELLIVSAGREESLALGTLAGAKNGSDEICLYVPPLPSPGAFSALQDVVARLRAPDGCPWDRELTWAGMRPFLLEETYELLAALDSGDANKVAEEQGDLFLQLALQAEIAIEDGKFRSGDVLAGIVSKLIRRHPHVFGDVVVSGTEEVLANWEAIKRTERAERGVKSSPLAGIPAGLPSLAQTAAYLDRVARLREIETPDAPWNELASAPSGVSAAMLGRALFGLVAWARARGIDAESALRQTNAEYAAEISD